MGLLIIVVFLVFFVKVGDDFLYEKKVKNEREYRNSSLGNEEICVLIIIWSLSLVMKL